MTDDNAQRDLMRHEREFGATNARLANLEGGLGTTRAEFKEALGDVRSDLKEGLNGVRAELKDGIVAIRDEMVRQAGHARAEAREVQAAFDKRLETLTRSMDERVDKLEDALEKQRASDEKRSEKLIAGLESSNDQADQRAARAQKLNRGIILGIGALLVGIQQIIEHLPQIMDFLQ